jgi:stage V sporulation protein AA
MSDTLYVKMDQSVELTKSVVTVADVVKLECKNQNVINRLKPIKLLTDDSNGKKRYIVSIMKILEVVDETFQNVDVQTLGETECVVEFKKAQSGKQYLDVINTVIVCFILFFGVGFSIMSFNNDVSVDDMFGKICELFTGNADKGRNLIELCYSVGLGVGIIVFYNHFGAKKLSKDPTPIEVEMRKYETDINQTLIDGHNRQDGRLDVK